LIDAIRAIQAPPEKLGNTHMQQRDPAASMPLSALHLTATNTEYRKTVGNMGKNFPRPSPTVAPAIVS
jgi:hypothetical protein